MRVDTMRKILHWGRGHCGLTFLMIVGLYFFVVIGGVALHIPGLYSAGPSASTPASALCLNGKCDDVTATRFPQHSGSVSITVWTPSSGLWKAAIPRVTSDWQTALRDQGPSILPQYDGGPQSVYVTVDLESVKNTGAMDVYISPSRSWQRLLESRSAQTTATEAARLINPAMRAAIQVGRHLPNIMPSLSGGWIVMVGFRTPTNKILATAVTGFGTPTRRSGIAVYLGNALWWRSTNPSPAAAWIHGGSCAVTDILAKKLVCKVS